MNRTQPAARGRRSTRKRPGDEVRARARREPGKAQRSAGSEGGCPIPDSFFRQVVSGMRNGVITAAPDGSLVFANEVAYAVLGIPPGDYTGRPVVEVLGPHADIARVILGAFEMKTLPNRAEMRLRATSKVIGYTLSLVHGEDGGVAGVAFFFKDLTRVEQLEERERLRDRLAALGEMAAALAHELKNPLAGIEVMAGLLRRHASTTPDMQPLVNDIMSEAKMANAIVQEALEFVRPIRLQVEHTSIGRVLHDAVRIAGGKVDPKDIELSVAVDDEIPPIQGDHHQLCQVFTNLLINAYESLGGRGRVAVVATYDGRTHPHHDPDQGPVVVVEVADNGPGIAPEVADRMFNPFFTTKPRGSGLGLAIVRRIVDAHDGRIDVETALGHGTSFRVTLPIAGGRQWSDETVRS